MANRLLRNLIAHTVNQLADMDTGFGKTKLVKLLYLIDVENYRRRRKTLSGLEWRFYYYGPYAFEIDNALDELSFDIPQEEVTTLSGHNAVVFRAHRELSPRLADYVQLRELRLVNDVIQRWGDTDFNSLLNHVYFHTEPMKDAKRGDFLDFSTIQRRRFNQSAARVPQLPKARLDEYKARFEEAKAKRVRQTLDPPPRFDSVYREAVSRMDQEEQEHGIIPAPINIPEEVKTRIREQESE
ncbi:MAG: Panacea domain-containing protein [Dehalococcoidia bacterium]|nr:Panacea domain-containing protein [Dehalococcoidia bacterium]